LSRGFKVAVLGSTGLVGQKFVELLADHPWFELVAVTASDQSVGKPYAEAVWCGESCAPPSVRDLVVERTSIEVVKSSGAEVVFSALPAEEALPIEVELAKSGTVVVSNASPMRMDSDVPLLNPEVNADHAELAKVQKARRGWKGFIAKVPNCTTAILTLALKPLADEFGLRKVFVATMQSASGAGLRGVSAVQLIDNVIPYIPGEEEKVESETRKILGSLRGEALEQAEVLVSASCHRVPVLEGHLEAVFVETKKPVEPEEAAAAMAKFAGNKIRNLGLPTAPQTPVIVTQDPFRPQPRLDRYAGRGMSVVVGRIRRDPATGSGLKFVVLGNNLVRGAAGTGVLIAELVAARWAELVG